MAKRELFGKGRILLTGAAGRLGAGVAEALLEKGHRLTLVVRNPKDVEKLGGRDYVLAVADLENTTLPTLEKLCRGCSQVVHLASVTHGPKKELFARNHVATRKLVEAARRAGVKRFILGSTTDVYGTQKGVITEETPKKPVDVYANSKLRAEESVMRGGIPWLIIRPTSVYAPDYFPRHSDFLRVMTEGGLPVVGDGSNHMALVHLSDAVSAYIAAIENGAVTNEDFIIAGPPITQLEAMNAFRKAVTARQGDAQFRKSLARHPDGTRKFLLNFKQKFVKWPDLAHSLSQDRVFSSAKAERVLGWKPLISYQMAAPELVAAMLNRRLDAAQAASVPAGAAGAAPQK